MDHCGGWCADERKRKGTKQMEVAERRTMVLDNPETQGINSQTTFVAISGRGCNKNGSGRCDRARCETEVAQRPCPWELQAWRNSHRLQDPRRQGLLCHSRNRAEHQPKQGATSSRSDVCTPRNWQPIRSPRSSEGHS